eukprot:scaffold66381_cov63-Phaeocystis_antarctica.AAC.13
MLERCEMGDLGTGAVSAGAMRWRCEGRVGTAVRDEVWRRGCGSVEQPRPKPRVLAVTGWRAALAVLDNPVICRAVLLLLAALASVVLHRISCRRRHCHVVPRRAGCPAALAAAGRPRTGPPSRKVPRESRAVCSLACLDVGTVQDERSWHGRWVQSREAEGARRACPAVRGEVARRVGGGAFGARRAAQAKAPCPSCDRLARRTGRQSSSSSPPSPPSSSIASAAAAGTAASSRAAPAARLKRGLLGTCERSDWKKAGCVRRRGPTAHWPSVSQSPAWKSSSVQPGVPGCWNGARWVTLAQAVGADAIRWRCGEIVGRR